MKILFNFLAVVICLLVSEPGSSKPGKRTSAANAVAADASLLGYWSFDSIENGMVKDSSGNGNHGSAFGITLETGKKGQALKFSAKDKSYVLVANSPSIDIDGPALTMMAWIKPASVSPAPGLNMILRKERQYSMGLRSSAVTYADTAIWDYNRFGAYGSLGLEDWQHLAITRDGSNVIVFLNGKEVGRQDVKGDLSKQGTPLYIGAYPGPTYLFDGLMDEVYLYKRALSAEEVAKYVKTFKR